MKKTFKHFIIKSAYTVAVFVLALFVTFRIINRTQALPASAAMPQASFPVVIMSRDGAEYNLLHGYAQEMDVSAMHGTLCVTDTTRQCELIVDTYGCALSGLFFEVRTTDGAHLVEQTALELPEEREKNRFSLSFSLKDLIEYDTEYMLVICLERESGDVLRYYTRIIALTDENELYLQEHLDFVLRLHEDIFTAPYAVRSYLEPDASGAEDSFASVTIHSPVAVVTLEGLEVEDRTMPQVSLYDLHGQTASVTLRYTLLLAEDGRTRRCHVVEDFFTRRTNAGMYLIDYRRTMDAIFSGTPDDIRGDYLDLSYQSKELQMMESDGGSAIAFVNEGRLFVYHLTENRLTQVFGFYEDEEDLRTGWQGARIRLLGLDETGNAVFRVTGYRNRGQHEGEVGTSVYEYHALSNTIDEMIWIATTQSEEWLMATADVLGYVNGRGVYYSILGNDVMAVDLHEGTQLGTVENILDDHFAVSESGHLIAWQNAISELPDSMTVIDMSSESRTEITAEQGEGVRLFGFIGDDIVYGIYRMSEVGTDAPGNPVCPCYQVVIRHFDGTEFTRYDAASKRVQDITLEADRLLLSLTEFENGVYTDAGSDQIMRTGTKEERINDTVFVETDQGVQMRLMLRGETDGATCKRFTAQETLTEMRIPDVKAALSGERYFCLDHGRVAGIFRKEADAVTLAYDLCGQVVDEQNRYIYYRGNQTARNQILGISTAVAGHDYSGRSSAEACLSVLLEYEGAGRNVEALLEKGKTMVQILEESLVDANVLSLDGCPLAAMLYYVDLMCDFPVIGSFADGRYVLLIGFNDKGVILFDPSRGQEAVCLMGMQEAANAFARGGNHFLTYIR